MKMKISILQSLYLLSIPGTIALAHPFQNVLSPHIHSSQAVLDDESYDTTNSTLKDLLDAIHVMQDSYFELWKATWPSSIDWTAAVVGTSVSATLSSLTSDGNIPDLANENIINRFFSHTSAFLYGENAISLRLQANDDMLWVVLGWLENIKFQTLHSDLHYDSNVSSRDAWHGTQFRIPAAHRARIFYDLASYGWDTALCGGGMIWSPYLTPYKNAITNELFISASIGMYLYHPGDTIDFPFFANSVGSDGYPHDPTHLRAAVEGYKWLKDSNMTGAGGLYADGFHVSGWQNILNPGTRKCDELNTMVYTYNQGVILSGLRGLWLATRSTDYLDDGHDLVAKVINATGWQKSDNTWAGLGRGGVLEEACDSAGSCSQDGQTFKGIFFQHFTEFCRPLRPQEKRFLAHANVTTGVGSEWETTYELHAARCRSYGPWIQHNAEAALKTRDASGKFGMWWGKQYPAEMVAAESSPLPEGAVDYRNMGSAAVDVAADATGDCNDRGRGRTVETQAGGVSVLRALYQWETL